MSQTPISPAALLVYGDALADIALQTRSFPQSGADALVDDLSIKPGGSAANCAAIAAGLGVGVRFVGLVGSDDFGLMLRADLLAHGVDVGGLREVEGKTAVVVNVIEPDGERTFFSYRGVAATEGYGPPPADLLRPGDCLHVSGFSFQTPHSRETALALVASAREAGAAVSLDPSYHFARQVVAEYPGALHGLAYLFPNREEAALITGETDPQQAALALREMGTELVALKMGAEGCLLATADGLRHVPASQPPRVVDTTGAGDAFAGGFLAARLRGVGPEGAAVIGHAAAALVVAEVGGHAAAPSLSDLRAFVQVDARLEMVLVAFTPE